MNYSNNQNEKKDFESIVNQCSSSFHDLINFGKKAIEEKQALKKAHREQVQQLQTKQIDLYDEISKANQVHKHTETLLTNRVHDLMVENNQLITVNDQLKIENKLMKDQLLKNTLAQEYNHEVANQINNLDQIKASNQIIKQLRTQYSKLMLSTNTFDQVKHLRNLDEILQKQTILLDSIEVSGERHKVHLKRERKRIISDIQFFHKLIEDSINMLN